MSAGRVSAERRGIALAREDRILAPREGYAGRLPRGTAERRVSGYRPKAKRDARRRLSRHLRTLRDQASNVRVSPRRACESLAKRSAGRGASRRPRAGLRRCVSRRAGSQRARSEADARRLAGSEPRGPGIARPTALCRRTRAGSGLDNETDRIESVATFYRKAGEFKIYRSGIGSLRWFRFVG